LDADVVGEDAGSVMDGGDRQIIDERVSTLAIIDLTRIKTGGG
jgi:hypothetical protein